MTAGMFIVRAKGLHHGPLPPGWAEAFAEKCGADAEVFPLYVPREYEESKEAITVSIVEDEAYRAAQDAFKVDTVEVLAGVTQAIFFARRAERVLTARELLTYAEDLYQACGAIESLMRHTEAAIENPSPERLESLRKAFWRNRGSSDVDPHYAHRNWCGLDEICKLRDPAAHFSLRFRTLGSAKKTLSGR